MLNITNKLLLMAFNNVGQQVTHPYNKMPSGCPYLITKNFKAMKPTTITTVLGEEITLTDKTWFVVCTDEFLSGWGCAEGKTAKRVCVCKDHQEAEKLFDRMFANMRRHQLRDIYTTPEFPYFPTSKYTVSIDKYLDSIYC